ncbi:DUF4249 domain-containing protein [Adhaeribacter sp. BT258]|uniref:DUF4249 domain-containing protein n=1 Tax=Adhaeribacter terrigena TaxID=2793070 RepID=A0ABS1C2G4_9BACT|nr:DUF4249 domain-containing protein [Adhaeribacter terrigena]MBK0403508.1 DUF4249 domain-containing protein [Adhaeribacter terrigena]
MAGFTNFSSRLFRLKTIAFWLAVFLFSACESVVEIPPLPEIPPKLVVVSFISPEADEVQVAVSRTVALLSPENNGKPVYVPNAQVTFSDGIDTVLLTYDAAKQLYTTKLLPVQPGKTYWLHAQSPDGLQAEARCTVPQKINTSLTARLDSSERNLEAGGKNYKLEMRWQDLPGPGDNYAIDGKLHFLANPGTTDTTFENLEFDSGPLFEDSDEDTRLWVERSLNITGFAGMKNANKLVRLNAFLLTTDAAYLKYHRSLQQYQVNNSFTSPGKLYTNVKGGFGVFAAYRLYKVQVPY